jgi:RHS repeat-associated protein
MPTSITNGGVTETYSYNADGQRVTRTLNGLTVVYLEGLTEELTNGSEVKRYYTLNGQTVAMRRLAGSTSTLTYLHGDHLGSVSLATTSGAGVESSQEFDPWGKVISGAMGATTKNFTGQHLDGTGLLFYNARYYDPNIGRFLSGDAIVPGNASGGMDGVAVKPLTVGFHEQQFLGKVNAENAMGFWFQLDDQQRQRMGSPMGPANAQALNRYAYVQNNPLKWIDPTGHTVYMSQKEGRDYVNNIRKLAGLFRDVNFISELTAAIAGGAAGIAALLIQYGLASSFVIAITPGLVVAAAILAVLAVPIALIAGKWAEQLDEFADLVSVIVERSPSGIFVANGCGGQGALHEACGVVVASLDDGVGIHANLGPVGFFIGYGDIWAPGRPYNFDGSKHYGDRLYKRDRSWQE